MSFDALITNPGRLRILTALASQPRQEFVHLRGVTRMTDGNLATHARRLHSAGLLDIDKAFRDGKPVTTFILTDQGRNALKTHIENVMRAMLPASTPAADVIQPTVEEPEDNWVD